MHQVVKTYDHDNYVLSITRDGMIMISLKQKVLDREGITLVNDYSSITQDPMHGSLSDTSSSRKWSLYLKYLNCVHLLLAAARQPICQNQHINHHLGTASMRHVIVTNRLRGGSLQSFSSTHSTIHWHAETGTSTVDNSVFDSRLVHHRERCCPVLPVSVFDELNRQLSVCDLPQVKILALVSQAVHHYQEALYDNSLTSFWIVIEHLVSRRFDLICTIKRSKRKTPVEKIRILKTKNLLPSSCFVRNSFDVEVRTIDYIDEVREARNKFVHTTASCTDGQCAMAYRIISDLIREDWTVDLPLLQSLPLQMI